MMPAMPTSPTILMCPPDYFGIEYEINPWMDQRRGADHKLATEQWQGLRKLLEEAGATIECMEPKQGMPDLVFTANAAVIFRRIAGSRKAIRFRSAD